jgi:alpha-galactosidase
MKKKDQKLFAIVILTLLLITFSIHAKTVVRYVWLDDLDVSRVQSGWGTAQRNKSVAGNPLTIAGQQFERGIGTHARSVFWIELDGWTSDFTAYVGVDDEVGNSSGTVEFMVFGKGKVLWKSGLMKAGDPAKK